MVDANIPPSILVLEENLTLSRLYGKVLKQAGYHVYLAPTVSDARILLMSDQHFDVFLCDLQIGQELLREGNLFEQQKPLQIIIVTGSGRFQRFTDELDTAFFLEKPVDINMLQAIISRALSMPKVQSTKL
jgi:DNA-binding NtrC family response regulator